MDYSIYLYRWNSRDLRKIIVSMLRSWVANDVQKFNYVKRYKLNGKDIEKEDVKLILVWTDKQENLDTFLLNNFPQIEKIKTIV